MKKRIISVVLCLCILMSFTATVNAFKFPQSFWAPNDSFAKAVETGNNYDIINYGKQLIDILTGLEDAPEKRNALVDRYNKVAKAYEAVGDYENSGYYYKCLYDYASGFGDTYLDYLKGAKSKYIQYNSRMTLYTDKGSSVFYGAKNEPYNGVLFGVCVNGETRGELDNESLILTYQELGEPLTTYNRNALGDAVMNNTAIEFALNCPRERNDIVNIRQMEGLLSEISENFRLYPDVKIFLRFAAEFNVWDNMPTAEEYIDSFRYVSRYFKDRNSNVAICWSPNHVSGYYTNLNDYYPGDEYVDWVGMSLYSLRYFLGDRNSSHDNQVFFRAGDASDPVIAVEDIVNEYGQRKPIMISEAGCGHTALADGENTTDYATKRLKEMLSYLPMVYPQIKAMAYFDMKVDSYTEKYDFRLSSNNSLKNVYTSLTKGDRFIQHNANNSSELAYREMYQGMNLDGKFPLSTYIHSYGKTVQEVIYYIDGEQVGRSSTVPYTVEIDSAEFRGAHSIKAVASFTDGTTKEKALDVKLNGDGDGILVKVSGKTLTFDQPPLIENGRTMVPMRAIFEELGAEVTWDDTTKTVTGIKGNREVKITIGELNMYVNGERIELDTPAMIVSGRTLVPVRAIAEGLGCGVNWLAKSKTVVIEPK